MKEIGEVRPTATTTSQTQTSHFGVEQQQCKHPKLYTQNKTKDGQETVNCTCTLPNLLIAILANNNNNFKAA